MSGAAKTVPLNFLNGLDRGDVIELRRSDSGKIYICHKRANAQVWAPFAPDDKNLSYRGLEQALSVVQVIELTLPGHLQFKLLEARNHRTDKLLGILEAAIVSKEWTLPNLREEVNAEWSIKFRIAV